MGKTLKIQRLVTTSLRIFIAGIMFLLIFVVCNSVFAFERYKDSGEADTNCSECHGDFDGPVSPKGTTFPLADKHKMHKDTMDTDCDLCHTSGDARNPYMGSSNGTDNNAGLGCAGCHVGLGLRAHHEAIGIECHGGEGPPAAESEAPPYYGTVDTLANHPCNDALVSNTNENWSVGDFLGLDNDGDLLYDIADFDCGPPYRIVGIEAIGSDIHISWETAGGRTDMLQATPTLTNTFTDAGSAITIPGVGFITNSTVVVGGAIPTNRFYRIRYAP